MEDSQTLLEGSSDMEKGAYMPRLYNSDIVYIISLPYKIKTHAHRF